jgi:autotransporter-associated beta strand protein
VFVGDNSSLGTGAVELAGGTLSLGVGFGLKGGRINGANWDTTTSAALLHTAAPSPPYAAGTVATYSGPVAANSTAGQSAMWPDNSTWVYSGQIWLDPTGITPGQVSFFRKFDDDSRLVIDGNIVFDGNQWNNQAYNVTGVSKGWHDFELRLGQGGGGVGPYDGWPFGFGVDSQGRGTTNSGDYVFPNGNAWFRTSGATSGLTLANNLTVTAESSLGGSTVEVPYHSATVTGSLNMGGGTAINPQLNVTGGGNRKVTISGPATTTSTGQPVYNVAANTTLELSGGYNDGGMGLSKSGNGTLLLSGGNALSVTGNTAVTAGKLVYDLSGTVTGVGSTLAITAGATVEAQNTADPFTLGTTHTAVNNDGSFSVLAGTKKVASISGTGTTTVNSSLVAGSIVQDTLVIGAGGSVTIAASVPFSGAAGANAVPEPGTILLTLLGGLCLGGWLWRRRAA